MPQKKQIATLQTRALVAPQTVDEETGELEVVFATETPVFRYGWDESYNEVLVCHESAVRMDRADKGLPVLDNHSGYSVFQQLGRTAEIWFADNQLHARLKLSERAAVKDLLRDIKDGIIKEISVGYQVFKFEREEIDGEELPVYRAIDWMPFEISFAPIPADINSGVRSAGRPQNEIQIISVSKPKQTTMSKKRSEEGTLKTVEYTVGDDPVKEGDRITLEDGTEGVALSDGESGETITLQITEEDEAGSSEGRTNDPDNDDDENQRSHDTTAGKKRMNQILASTRAAGLSSDYAIELFNSKLTLAQCRQKVIEKATGAQTPVNNTHSSRVVAEAIDKKRDAVMGVLLHRVNARQFKLEKGSEMYRGMTLLELGKELLTEHGVNVRGKSKAEIAGLVFSRAHGTSDFPLIFESVIDKQLRAEYAGRKEFWDKIARSTTVNDFRAKSMYQFTTVNGMKEIPEGGEIKYTTIKEGKESIRVKSFGEGIQYTRQAFINDDLGALERIPGKFRRDWDRTRGNLVWGLITDNVKMADEKELFHADHKNLLTGTGSQLNEKGLNDAKTMFQRQKDLEGVEIHVDPVFLIVPPELEVAARKLMTATTPASTKDVNVFANQFDIIVEGRITNKTEWYLSADPFAIDSLYYANLEGEQDLRVNTEHEFDTDTMKFAVRGEFGTAAIDYRGLLKATGK